MTREQAIAGRLSQLEAVFGNNICSIADDTLKPFDKD